jgi:hypothetical protein
MSARDRYSNERFNCFMRDQGVDPADALKLAEAICSPSPRKRCGRPKGSLGAKAISIRGAVLALQDEFEVVTVRGAFYALTVRGIVPKTENGGYRPVQTQILRMRREKLLPWEFVADGTRWVNEPETWDRAEDVLRETARTYRRNLWRSQQVRIEFWLEKDALASLISPVTHDWGVRLMVSRGQSSDTYCYAAAQDAKRAWNEAAITTIVYALYDSDKSGRIAASKVEEKLRAYSDGTPITFELLAVTDDQIEAWNLPTRPAKEKGEPDAVELDAIPPDKLKDLVENAITLWIDEEAWKKEQAAEESERQVLERIVEGL